MRTDVTTLIAALTTERDSLTRAINSLQAISSGTAPILTSNRKMRAVISADVKAAVVERMKASTHKSRQARELSQEFGIAETTILTGWQRWQAGSNGQASDSAVQH